MSIFSRERTSVSLSLLKTEERLVFSFHSMNCTRDLLERTMNRIEESRARLDAAALFCGDPFHRSWYRFRDSTLKASSHKTEIQ